MHKEILSTAAVCNKPHNIVSHSQRGSMLHLYPWKMTNKSDKVQEECWPDWECLVDLGECESLPFAL